MGHFALIRHFLMSRRECLDDSSSSSGIRWTPRSSLIYPGLCSLAGVFAGMFGIGGGMIKSPLMLELGIVPQVASATSTFMILFTTSSAFGLHLALGQVQLDLAWKVFVLGFVVTLGSTQSVLGRSSRSNKKNQHIVLAMLLVLVLSTVLMGYESLSKLMLEENWKSERKTGVRAWLREMGNGKELEENAKER